jgi:hypothetical protein
MWRASRGPRTFLAGWMTAGGRGAALFPERDTTIIRQHMVAPAQTYVDRPARDIRPFTRVGNEVGGPHAPSMRLRFLRLFLRLLGGVVLGLSACGNVTFIDAPFAPRQIVILYSVQEDLTVVRWRMSAAHDDPAVGFELLDSTGTWRAVDFATAPYPGGVAPCGSGKELCAQLVIPGRYQPPEGAATPLRSLNSTYGLSPGNGPSFQRYLKTLTLTKSYFLRGNGMLATKITDVIGGDDTFVFPRTLQQSVWERRGVCVDGFFPADAPFAPVDGLDKPWPAPAVLSAKGEYCAAVRALKSNGDPGVDDQLAADTQPEVTDASPSYTAPTEVTPFSYQIVLDLSIPVADRCQEATQSIHSIQSTVAGTLSAYSPLRTLPVIDLSAGLDPETGMAAVPCRQSPQRKIDATGTGLQVLDAAATWPEQHQRYFLLYFNNLRAPLPALLTQSFDDLRSAILARPTSDFGVSFWPFGPPEMIDSYMGWGDQQTTWSSVADIDFVQELNAFGGDHLPLISEIQDPNEPIDLLSKEDAQRLDGSLLRLCEVSITPPLQGTGLEMIEHNPAGDVVILPPSTAYPVRQSDPPAYLLNLPPVWAVSSKGFTPHKAIVRYEVCTRYCTHAFTAESGIQVQAPPGWSGSSFCMGPA